MPVGREFRFGHWGGESFRERLRGEGVLCKAASAALTKKFVVNEYTMSSNLRNSASRYTLSRKEAGLIYHCYLYASNLFIS